MTFGEVFVGAVIQAVVEMLASGGIAQILKYFKGKKIDPSTTQNFEKNLRMIAALLKDAQERRIENETFKIWVEELQDLAYDLDDVLDELTTDAQLKQQQPAEDNDEDHESMGRNFTCLQAAKTKVKSILACGSQVVQRFNYSGGDLPSKIEEINNRLQQIQTQGQDLGLTNRSIIKQDMQFPMEASKQISGRETTSLANEPVVYGREEKQRDVIHELLKEESGKGNYAVIPIIGNGGIGKTTLAQYVYNDKKLKDRFNFMAWVCVSDVFDGIRVTTDIINSSRSKCLKFSNLNEAQNQLIEEIKDKKFLIVLDDIWNKKYDDWIQLQKPFQHGAMGSKVIVTTRDKEIANMVKVNPTDVTFNLKGLSDEDCWRLFQQHANEDSNNDLVEVKADIINKCKGLPLAAKALGGLFRKTTEIRQRRMILNSNIWAEKSEVLPVLRLSYYHLPPQLKSTFAFCCIFPKDYEFGEMEVILLWMAQGFLIREGEKRFEDVGQDYFHDLVSRSLFEPHTFLKNRYKMHDLVHDLAQWAASDICSCIMDTNDVERQLERTRHLYITTSGIDHSWSIVEPIAPKLRTLIANLDGLNVGFPNFFEKIRCMRALILASETIEQMPECLGDLKHLRFLDLRFTKIQVLPNSVRKLCNLQVFFLDGCCNLREVTNISFLVKLRHLRFHQSLWEAMPWGFGKLTNLQSLGGSIYLGDDNKNGSIIRELGSLNHLQGELSIIGMENVRAVDDAREAQLHEKKGLTKLYLCWDDYWSDDWNEVDDKNARDVMEALRPASCMEKVKLKGYMGMKLPSWLGDGSFKNVVSIKLIRCWECECLPPLGLLPWLKKLVVKGMSGIREVGPSAFSGPSCLEELRVGACYNLDTVNEIPFSLVMLKIKKCPTLKKVEFKKSLPLTVATSSAPSKATIIIESCQSLLTVCRIPLTVEGLKIHYCKKVKYLLFGNMSAESEEEEEEEEEEKAEVAGRRQEESEGVGSMEVSKKQNQIKSPIELAHLLKLEVSSCSNFISLPEDLILPSVQSLGFWNNEEQEALPEQIHTFTSFEDLFIEGCPNVRRFAKGGLPRTETLTSIRMKDLKIEEPPIGEWGFHLLPHLQTLQIFEIGRTTDDVECIPGPHLPLPSSLSRLWIKGFKNLKSIYWACFPNLTLLFILECPKLENFGDYNSPPPNLPEVVILNCPMIQKQCQPDPNGLIKFNTEVPRYSLIRG